MWSPRVALRLALAWCMLLFTCTAQVQLSIKCDTTTSSLTLDPCAGISQHNLPAACATANAITLTNPALSTVHAVVQGDQVFAQGHALNTTCTRRGCPFGMQHPTPMTNAAPFPCVACAPPDFQAVKQAKSATASNQYKYYVACPKAQGDPNILSCPVDTSFAPLPGTDWLLPSKADCESVAFCAVGLFRSQAGTCLPCPHGAASEERGARFRDTCLCPPGTQSGNDACATCVPGFYQPETRAAVACQACATAKLHGATSCESDTACQNGVLRSDGVCLTRPTTVAAVFDLVASGQLAWADPDAAPDRGSVALRRTEPSIDTADDLLELAPTCPPSAGRDATGQCQPCPAGQRGNGGACEPVPCAYGDIEPENRTCVLDKAYAQIMQHNVSQFCYPVRRNATATTTCAPCVMGHRTDPGRYDGAVNTLQSLWPPPPGPSPCHYRCESGYEERAVGQGCWPCLPGHAGLGCQACPAGTHSSVFRGSEQCVECAAGKFSLGQQHVCTPCVDRLGAFKVWRAVDKDIGCVASATVQQNHLLTNSSTPAMYTANDTLCINNVTFATDGLAYCHPDTDRVLGQCAANATRPNCIATARVQSAPDTDDACDSDNQYTLDTGGCGNCSDHVCASPDAYLVPHTCPPVCRSCLENASDGQDVVASAVRRIGGDACRLFCAAPFVAAEFFPADIQSQLHTRPCVRVLPGPDLERVSDGHVRCDPAQGAKLTLDGETAVFCKRPVHDCARRNARPRPGSTSECECLAGFYAADAAVSHCLQCPSDRTSVPGAALLSDCLCRPGFVAPIDDAQAPCQMCPSNSTFFCSGNTTKRACADHARTVLPGAFASHHCVPDVGFERTNDVVRACDASPEGQALSRYTPQRGQCARSCLPGSTFEPGQGCRCNAAQGFAYVDAEQACRCRPGFWRRNATACEVCPRGSFCPGLSVEFQEECPDVLHTTAAGATHQDNCTCASGYFQQATTCLPCPTQHVCFDNAKIDCFETDNTDEFRKSVQCQARRQSRAQVCPPGSEFGEDFRVCTNYDKYSRIVSKILTNVRGGSSQILAYPQMQDFLRFVFENTDYSLIQKFGQILSYTVAARLQLVCGDWALVPREAISPDALMFATTAASLQCFNTSHLGSPGPRVQVSSGLAFLGPGGLADLSRSRDDQTYRTVGAHLAWNLVVACADTAWLPGCASGCARDTHRLTHDAAHSFTVWMPEPQVVVVDLDAPAQRVWSKQELAWAPVPVDECDERLEAPVLARVLRQSGQISREQLAEVVDAGMLAGLHAKVCVRVDTAWWQPAGWGAAGVTFSRAGTTRPMLLDPAREGTAPPLRAALTGARHDFSWTELRSLDNDVVRGGYVRAVGQSADYYVREDVAAAVVPRHAVAMLTGDGRLMWRLLGDGGHVAQVVHTTTAAQALAATVASTWAWNTSMDTLPGLLALTCTDDTRTDLVVCHPVTGTCASTTIEDPTAKLCGDVRRARVVQHHLPLNLLYLMTPTGLWSIYLTDFAALPTPAPILTAQPLLTQQIWTSLDLVMPWSYALYDDEHACAYVWHNYTLSVYRGEDAVPLRQSTLDPLQLERLVATTLDAQHHMEREAWTLDIVDHKIAAPTVRECTQENVDVQILCRARGTTLYLVVHVQASFAGAEVIEPRAVLGVRVLSPLVDPASVRWSTHARPAPASTAATAPVNVLQTVLNLELTYASRQTLHFERFRSTCNACLGDEIPGANDTCTCPPGTTRACLPCGEFCAAQTLTWKSSASACAVPAGLHDGDPAYTTCLPCAGRAYCPEPTQPVPCPPGRYVLDARATTAAACACPVNHTTLPHMRRFLHNSSLVVRHVSDANAQDGVCVACDPEVELCYPMLGPGQTLLCPPGTRRQVREDWSSAPFETQITLHCVCAEGSTATRTREVRVDAMDAGPLAVQQARLLDWTGAAPGIQALLERASFAVHVDTCVAAAPTVVVCPAGEYAENGKVCTACPRNFFCPAVGLKPVPCPLGQTTAGKGSQAVKDCACVPGQFRVPGEACQACPENDRCVDGRESTPCEQGQIAAPDHLQCTCPANTTLDAATGLCETDRHCPKHHLRAPQDLAGAQALLLSRARGLVYHALAVPDKAVLLQYQGQPTEACVPCPPVLACTGSAPPEEHAGAAACALSAAGCATYGTLWTAPARSGAWALAWPSVVRIDTREGPSTVLNFVTQYNKTFFAEMAWASVPQVVERDTEPGVFEVFAEIRVDFLNRTAWWPHGGEGDAVENATRVSRAWYHRAQQVLAMDPRARALLLAGRLLWNVQLERVLAQRYPDAELAFLGDDAPVRAVLGGACFMRMCRAAARRARFWCIVQGSWC